MYIYILHMFDDFTKQNFGVNAELVRIGISTNDFVWLMSKDE